MRTGSHLSTSGDGSQPSGRHLTWWRVTDGQSLDSSLNPLILLLLNVFSVPPGPAFGALGTRLTSACLFLYCC